MFAARAAWLRALSAATVQAAVPRTARPMEPPTCWPVLSRLEATPESPSLTRDSAVNDSGTDSSPSPQPTTRVGPRTVPA